MTEILNITYHTRILILKALNQYKNHELAAKALGITERSLYTLKRNYRIFKESGVYKMPNIEIVTIHLCPSEN